MLAIRYGVLFCSLASAMASASAQPSAGDPQKSFES